MKFSLSWLREWIALDQRPEELAEVLTMLGLEVEACAPAPLSFEGVVVGKVIETAPHPDADRLTVATVSDGTDTFQVVCGAPNCRVGLITAFARVGAKLTTPEGETFKIKKGKLRGVESRGMLCALNELQLGTESEGIAELPTDWEVGTDLVTHFGDVQFEIALTPNLAHCASLRGIAQELSAYYKTAVTPPSFELQASQATVLDAVSVSVEAQKGSPRYACRVIRGVEIAPSPNWLQARLESAGIRSINNLVDVTNYVMLEWGQPLHAFDLKKLQGGKLVVRQAQEGEQLRTLDGKERTLHSDMMVIADGQRPVALAGVIGGEETEVSDTTQDVLLEAAHFTPQAVRSNSKRSLLKTESSKRFERGCDPNEVLHALDRAAALIQQLAGGEILQQPIDLTQQEFPPVQLTCRVERVNQLLGTTLAGGEMETLLKALGFGVTRKQHALLVEVPTWRPDVHREIDVIEEIGRLYGYQNIKKRAPKFQWSGIDHSPLFLFEREMRKRLISLGLYECCTSSLIGPHQAAVVDGEPVPPEQWVHVLNPSSSEQSILRPSLLPSLLHVAQLNQHQQQKRLALFEIGTAHLKVNDQFEEESLAAILLCGPRLPLHWEEKPADFDFFDGKGKIEALLNGLGLKNIAFHASQLSNFHPGRQAAIVIGEQKIGTIGEVHPEQLRAADVSGRVVFAELSLNSLMSRLPAPVQVTPLPQFPGSERDWTVTLDDAVLAADLERAIAQIPSRLLQKVELIDIYRSPSVGEGKKNVTMRFTYRDDRKTLLIESVEREHERIIQGTMEKLA